MFHVAHVKPFCNDFSPNVFFFIKLSSQATDNRQENPFVWQVTPVRPIFSDDTITATTI